MKEFKYEPSTALKHVFSHVSKMTFVCRVLQKDLWGQSNMPMELSVRKQTFSLQRGT